MANSELAPAWMHDLLDQGVLITDAELAVRGWNTWLSQRSGRSAADVLGRNLLELYPELAARQLDRVYREALAGRVQVLSQRLHRYLLPLPAPAEVAGFAQMAQSARVGPLLEDGRIVGTVTIIEDVTERVAREHELQRLLEQERAARAASERATARITKLQVITAEFTQALTPDQIAETAVRALGDALGAAAACVMQVSADNRALEHLHSAGYPEETRAAWRRIALDSDSPLAEAFRTGAPVLADAGSAHLPRLEHGQPATLIATPLAVGSRVLGVLGVSFAEPRSLATEDRDFLHALAQQCAQALDRAWLYEAEQHARAEAESAVRVRDQFLSIASHELRTPLTSLLGNIQMLQRRLMRGGTLAERDQHALRVATEQALRLNQMIGMLLDVSRIEQGLLSLERVPMDVTALVRRVIEEAQPNAAQHKLLLDIPAAPLVIDGDALRLEQVIQNLLGNAIKYSPGGGEVVVRVTPRDQMACVAVSDQGIGIPKDTLPKLFQRFYRAPNALDHRIEGTGVGLYVVREIVHLHGGELHVDSVERVGSTFTVCLPLSLPAAHTPTIGGAAEN